jgi:uncharacterized protein YkwD
VGIDDSERNGEDTVGKGRSGRSPVKLLAAVVVAAALVLAVLGPAAARQPGETGLKLQLLPGLPTITIGEKSLYPEDDPWQDWLADEATCPRGEDAQAPPDVQVQVLYCLLNFAREQQGLMPLAPSSLLGTTASTKARDIVLCHEFSHEACGKPAFQVADDVGYHGSIGENLYVAEGRLTAPRYALDTWLNSPPHRENLFQPEWRTTGIAMLGGANFDDIEDGIVWVNHFGP